MCTQRRRAHAPQTLLTSLSLRSLVARATHRMRLCAVGTNALASKMASKYHRWYMQLHSTVSPGKTSLAQGRSTPLRQPNNAIPSSSQSCRPPRAFMQPHGWGREPGRERGSNTNPMRPTRPTRAAKNAANNGENDDEQNVRACMRRVKRVKVASTPPQHQPRRRSI